jgi:hypothetical protein
MKKLLIIPFLFVCYLGMGQSSTPDPIIGKPIKFGNLFIAQNDFPKQMNWTDAKKLCAALGKGWRLPTQDELSMIYQNKEKIGSFSDGEFWSSVEGDESSAWVQNITNGGIILMDKEEVYYVRAVRSL